MVLLYILCSILFHLRLKSFIVTDEVQAEVENVVTDYLAQYVGKQFKSLEILRVIAENENA